MTESPDYYATKMRGRPRHVYREAHEAIKGDPGRRHLVLKALVDKLLTQAAKGDFRKMKLLIPASVRDFFFPHEIDGAESALADLRDRRNPRLRMVYPHASDEFELTPAFIDSAFNMRPLPIFGAKSNIFTIGSCFARNIAEHLKAMRFNAEHYPLAEDLNSPMANATLLQVAIMEPKAREVYLRRWLAKFERKPDDWVNEAARLDRLKDLIGKADVVIVTLGTTLDFFLPEGDTAPKFLMLNPDHPDHAEHVTTKLRDMHAALRPGTFLETKRAIHNILLGLRSVMKASAHVVFTVSPVPLEMAIGAITPWQSAIEVDCISKSTIRAALADYMQANLMGGTDWLHYFPSFEIVRWVGAMMPFPLFGAEDGASRHVSAKVLACVYDTFIRKHAAPLGQDVVSRAR